MLIVLCIIYRVSTAEHVVWLCVVLRVMASEEATCLAEYSVTHWSKEGYETRAAKVSARTDAVLASTSAH